MESNPGALCAFLVLGAVLIRAMWTDLMRREISNAACVAAAISAAAYAAGTGGMGAPAWESALLILVCGFILSAFFGVIGAGDVKLLAAVALGFPGETLELLLYTAWSGGVVALVVLIWNLFARKRTTELPYGIAIGSAVFLLIFKHLS